MGILAGYQGYRPLATFVEEHHEALCQLFGIELQCPSYSTFRRVMLNLEFQELGDRFEQWMCREVEAFGSKDPVTSIDGKRIRQAQTDVNGKERFVGLVSLFAVEQGVTLKLQSLTEANNSEIKVVQQLLETLQLDGLIITMDALHAQKNIKACA